MNISNYYLYFIVEKFEVTQLVSGGLGFERNSVRLQGS